MPPLQAPRRRAGAGASLFAHSHVAIRSLLRAPFRALRRQVALVLRSVRTGRIRRVAAKIARAVAPGLMRRRARRRITPAAAIPPGGDTDPLLLTAEARRLEYRPLISVLVPVYNTAPTYLKLCVESVLDQVYPEWELIMCDDGSTQADTRAALKRLTSLDPRIRVHLSEANQGISTATNTALADARGEFVAMLDHDDEMLPGALFEVAKALNADHSLDVIYTDQDYVEADGSFAQHFYKPDWSFELFRGVMYVGHLLVVRRSVANKIGGFDQAQDPLSLAKDPRQCRLRG
jgi:hypothetical protein